MSEKLNILEFRSVAEGENFPGGAFDAGLPITAHVTMDAIKANSSARLYLVWEGNKVPRGVELPGGTIGWTQHGLIISEDGKDIGTYDRLEEFGGPDRSRHQMLIYPR